MRLPTAGGMVDYEETYKMVGAFLNAVFSHFDTAHGYFDGKGEIALREYLTPGSPVRASS